MPGEPGEMEAMRGAILGWVSQGLQRNVIGMAFCCKKGGTSDFGNSGTANDYTAMIWDFMYHGPKA